MPGLAGLISPVGSEPLRQHLDGMVQAMRCRPDYLLTSAIHPPLALASVSLRPGMEVAENEAVVLAFSGHIVDDPVLRERLKGDGDPLAASCPIPDLLLRAFIRYGTAILCGLNGLYVVVVWEHRPARLTIINDRSGFANAYYWHGPDVCAFACECKALCTLPGYTRGIDQQGMAEFLTTSFPLGDRTLFKGIKRLLPASILVYERGVLRHMQYWDYTFGEPEPAPQRDERLTDEFAFYINEAVRKRAYDRTCLQLTGGLDSRSLGACLRRHAGGLAVKAVSLGHAHCHDVRFGRRVAHRLGFDHTFIPVGPDYVGVYSREGVLRTEGNLSCHCFWYLAQGDYIEQNGLEYVMTGNYGGIYRPMHAEGEFYGHLMRETTRERAFQLLYDAFYATAFKDKELEELLRPEIARNVRGACFDALREVFYRPDTRSIENRCDYVSMVERERRFITGGAQLLGVVSTMLDPLADTHLVDFNLRERAFITPEFFAHTIVKHFPEVKDIPETGSALPLEAPWLKTLPTRAYKRFYHKLLPKLSGGRLGNHDYMRYVHYNEWLRTGSRDFVEQVMRQTEYLEDLVNVDVAQRWVDDHMSGRIKDYSKVCTLVTLSLWRQQFG
ncbi:MAG: hypothetical protein HYZ00_00140 [Candidatus Hydrogenedentes bacterium]|nr:hypothetical protein [Candidatus Hydrogenedentota bacterium]